MYLQGPSPNWNCRISDLLRSPLRRSTATSSTSPRCDQINLPILASFRIACASALGLGAPTAVELAPEFGNTATSGLSAIGVRSGKCLKPKVPRWVAKATIGFAGAQSTERTGSLSRQEVGLELRPGSQKTISPSS